VETAFVVPLTKVSNQLSFFNRDIWSKCEIQIQIYGEKSDFGGFQLAEVRKRNNKNH
jgi:hypothetical protein